MWRDETAKLLKLDAESRFTTNAGGSKLRMTQVIEEVLPGHPAGVLTGPNLAREIMAGQAAAAVVAIPDEHAESSVVSRSVVCSSSLAS